MIKSEKKTLLEPYKTQGVFVDKYPGVVYNLGKKLFFAVTCGHSYKVYKLPELKLSFSS
jgi:hypothetical protein